MCTRCFCDKCRGDLVFPQVKLNHQRKQLKTKMISEQLKRKCDILPAKQHGAGPSSLISPVHLHPLSGILTLSPDVYGLPGTSDEPRLPAQSDIFSSDIDIFTHVIHDTPLEILTSAVNVIPEYILGDHQGEYIHEEDVDFPDEDAYLDNADLGDEGDNSIYFPPFVSGPTEDDTDPFMVEARNTQVTGEPHELDIPIPLLVVYMMVTWLHFQFHLPHVVCNAVLAFLALLFRFFQLAVMLPFITLQSATRALGVDPGVELLAICPNCQGIYPSSG